VGGFFFFLLCFFCFFFCFLVVGVWVGLVFVFFVCFLVFLGFLVLGGLGFFVFGVFVFLLFLWCFFTQLGGRGVWFHRGKKRQSRGVANLLKMVHIGTKGRGHLVENCPGGNPVKKQNRPEKKKPHRQLQNHLVGQVKKRGGKTEHVAQRKEKQLDAKNKKDNNLKTQGTVKRGGHNGTSRFLGETRCRTTNQKPNSRRDTGPKPNHGSQGGKHSPRRKKAVGG